MSDTVQRFYIVLNETADHKYKRHESFQAATDEARRLAGKQPGDKFAVLEVKRVYEGVVSIVDRPVKDFIPPSGGGDGEHSEVMEALRHG